MNFSKSFIMAPIVLSVVNNLTVTRTELLFSESEIIDSNYLKSAMRSIASEHSFYLSSNHFMNIKFEELYKKWIDNTMFLSSPKAIIEEQNFQTIIDMGEHAIPLILRKIEVEPSQLVWALNIITNKKVSSNPTISISDSCKRWVKYGKQNLI